MKKVFFHHDGCIYRIERENSHNYYAYFNGDTVWNLKFTNDPIPEIEWHRFDGAFQTLGIGLRIAPYFYFVVLNSLLGFKEFRSTPKGRNSFGLQFQLNLRIPDDCVYKRSDDRVTFIYRRKNVFTRWWTCLKKCLGK